MVIITGSITARPEHVEALKAAGIAHSARSRTEDGCLLHTVHVDAENPLKLVFIEHWRDKAAVLVHFARDDARAFVAEAAGMAAARPTLAMFEASPFTMEQLRGGA